MKIVQSRRAKVVLVHFLISCTVFAIFAVFLLVLWYPAPFFSASGGWQGLRIVAAVDLILGPCLTFVVFRVEKSHRELYFDLGLIATFQIIAFLWGAEAVHGQRPVAAVYWQGSFYTVPAMTFDKQRFDINELEKFGDLPVFVYARAPRTIAEHEALLDEIEATRTAPHENPDRYEAMVSHDEELRAASIDIDRVIEANTGMKQSLLAILDRTSTEKTDNYYIPLISRYRNIILIFSKDNEIIGTLSAPFKEGPQ